ncbi:hypothetical protein NC652_016155 [Populus alba x Populus x berolinensis]|nr:hypothetical protein NC652_016155 [Populus alba x Populus x berolinensis]
MVLNKGVVTSGVNEVKGVHDSSSWIIKGQGSPSEPLLVHGKYHSSSSRLNSVKEIELLRNSVEPNHLSFPR